MKPEKRLPVLVVILSLLALVVLCCGCGALILAAWNTPYLIPLPIWDELFAALSNSAGC